MLTGMKERSVGEQGLFGARVGWLSRVLGRGICTWSWGSQGAMDGRQVLIHVLVAVGGGGRGRGGGRTGRSLEVAEIQAGIGDVAVGGEDRER